MKLNLKLRVLSVSTSLQQLLSSLAHSIDHRVFRLNHLTQVIRLFMTRDIRLFMTCARLRLEALERPVLRHARVLIIFQRLAGLEVN